VPPPAIVVAALPAVKLMVTEYAAEVEQAGLPVLRNWVTALVQLAQPWTPSMPE
jgi:hypothetical protein